MSLLTLSLVALASFPDDSVTNPKFASAKQDGEVAAAPADDAATPEEEEPEPPKWTGNLTFGSSVTGGNTDIKKSSLTADGVKELEKSRYTLGFLWNFSQEDDEISQRRVFGTGQFDRFITDRFYWLAQLTAETDKNASVDLRTTVGGGLGYQFLDNEKWKLSGEAGLSWLDERFATDEDNAYLALRAAYKVDWIPNDIWSLSQAIQVFPSLEDIDDIYAKVDTRLKVNISGSLFAQLQWIYDWNNTPAAGKERVDNLYLLTIGWKF